MNNLPPFQFKQFSLSHHKSALKIGTDSVLLASVIPDYPSKFVLDIGCGCGVILFCIAAKNFQEHNNLQFYTGVDIDSASIEEANENKRIFPNLSCQYFRFLHTSIQDFSVENLEYDLIVSNPPFFGNSLASPDQQKQLSKHRDAHLSFEDLTESVKTLLSDDGFFYLILPPQEMTEFDKMIIEKGLFSCYQMNVYPIQGKPIHRIIKGYCKKNPAPYEIQNLCIREKTQEYSAEYKALTEPFYIKW
jgi:tRNA1Val (adenine37-N6)-methyltransferase